MTGSKKTLSCHELIYISFQSERVVLSVLPDRSLPQVISETH